MSHLTAVKTIGMDGDIGSLLAECSNTLKRLRSCSLDCTESSLQVALPHWTRLTMLDLFATGGGSLTAATLQHAAQALTSVAIVHVRTNPKPCSRLSVSAGCC